MKRIETLEELKHIQLEMMLSLHQFCIDNNINYSLAAGTLIGAIRHDGFIPWDDDIDVYMLRDEYNKFVSVFPILYEDKYSFISVERNSQWHRSYGKVYDTRTIEIERTRNANITIGIGIDVFPIDDVPDDYKEWLKYEKKRRFLRDVFTLKTLQLSSERVFFKNVITLLGQVFLAPFSFSFLSKCMDQYSQKNNGRGFVHVYENSWGVYNSKHPWLKDDISEVIDTSFEGHTLKIMKGYHDYLTCVYGDYMKLPPEEKRVSHHSFEAYWK